MKQVILCIGVCFCNDSSLAGSYILVVYFGSDSTVEAGYAEVDAVHDACADDQIDQLLSIISYQVKGDLSCLGIFLDQLYDGSIQGAHGKLRMGLIHSVVDLEGRREYVVEH